METYPHQLRARPRVARAAARRQRGGCARLARRGCLALFAAAVVIGLAAVVAVALVYASLSQELQDDLARLKAFDENPTFQTTQIFDRNGVLLYEIFDEGKRTRIALKDMPADLINATIATEDTTFWDNPGVEPRGIVAALVRMAQAGGEPQGGGSTITQQVVRDIAFSYEERTEQSFQRKAKEALLALSLARMKSKEEILELYLNQINYGNLNYGVEAAAQSYFGKPARELTRAEATALAGLPQAPAWLDPVSPDAKQQAAAHERRRTVLALMVKHGYLTRAEADATLAEPLNWQAPKASLIAPHFVVYVRKLLEERHGPQLVARGGLRVTTTLDVRYQALAEQIARDQVSRLRDEHHLTNAALVALKPGTGEILAMLGSVDYHDDAIQGRVNVALSERQPGSAMKPLTYAAAFELGLSPADVAWDVETRFPQFDGSVYTPLNYDRRYHGPVRLRDALANSYNVPAVDVMQFVGVERLLDFAHRLGIHGLQRGPEYYGLALTLGGGEVTPLDLTAAYGVFANGGRLVEPAAILKVEDSTGHVLYRYPGAQPRDVLDPRIAYQITSVLSDNIARTPAFGADSPLRLDRPAAVKTGTTDDYRDNWTVGYTPSLVVGVWAGNADNTEMKKVSGVQGAAPIWHDFVTAVYSDTALSGELAVGAEGSRAVTGGQPLPTDFVRPAGIEERPVCVLASLQDPAFECPAQRSEVFLKAPLAPPAGGETPAPGVVTTTNRVELEPGLLRLRVLPVPADIGARLLPPPLAGGQGGVAPLRYCAVPDSLGQPGGSTQQLFVPMPTTPQAVAGAVAWAQEHNLPLAPPSCDLDMLVQSTGGQGVDALWTITSPRPGETITQSIPIVGTAQFGHDQVKYYKVELGQGENPQVWGYLGGGQDPISNGELATLPADALAPGPWVIRLVIVKNDGNFPAPYQVPIVVAR